MNGYPDWLINSTPSIQHALESITFVLSDDTNDDGQEFGRDITTKKPTSKKSPVVLPYIKGVRKQIRRVLKQYEALPAYFEPMNTLHQLLVRLKDKILKEQVVGPLWDIPCDSCDVSYTGKTERSSKARFFGAKKTQLHHLGGVTTYSYRQART